MAACRAHGRGCRGAAESALAAQQDLAPRWCDLLGRNGHPTIAAYRAQPRGKHVTIISKIPTSASCTTRLAAPIASHSTTRSSLRLHAAYADQPMVGTNRD